MSCEFITADHDIASGLGVSWQLQEIRWRLYAEVPFAAEQVDGSPRLAPGRSATE